MKDIIYLKDVYKGFDGKIVLQGVTLSIKKGEKVVIKGPNGCGKTTLLKIIGGILTPDSGTVRTVGRISFVFQEPIFLPWLSMEDNLYLVSKDKKSIETLIDYFSLRSFLRLYPDKLSGGYRQIFSLIRAFIVNADIILLDEPFKSLDRFMKERALDFLGDYTRNNNVTLVSVSHEDDSFDIKLGDRVIYLSPLKTNPEAISV